MCCLSHGISTFVICVVKVTIIHRDTASAFTLISEPMYSQTALLHQIAPRPMAPLPEKDKRLWNRIYLDKIPNAINPHICIRCLQRKDESGVNTVCAACRLYLDAPKNAAEDFLFSTCLRIFHFWLWLRRQTLSDEFVLRNREHGAAVEHYIGMPGDKQELPSLSGDTKLAGDDGGHGCELQSPMARELLKQVMLTSRQCDRVMVLLADIMEQELLQGD